MTSQLPISMWHQAMAEQTLADAVLDRLLHNLHRVELAGESMRKPDGAPPPAAEADPSTPDGAPLPAAQADPSTPDGATQKPHRRAPRPQPR